MRVFNILVCSLIFLWATPNLVLSEADTSSLHQPKTLSSKTKLKTCIIPENDTMPKNKTRNHDPCSGLIRIKRDTFPTGVKKFRFESDTKLAHVVTSDTFFIYENDQASTTITLDTQTSVYLNKGNSFFSAICVDLSTKSDVPSKKSLQCSFLNRWGSKVDRRFFSKNAQGLTLVDTGFVVSEGGKLQLYDFNSDSVVWKTEEIFDDITFGPNFRYFLVSYSGFKGPRNELRHLQTGRLLSRNAGIVTRQAVSTNGKRIFQVSKTPRAPARTLKVFTQNFDTLAQWKNLPFEGQYTGRFYPKRHHLFVPLSTGVLFSADYKNKESDTFPFPVTKFKPQAMAINENTGNLLLYGPSGTLPYTAKISSDISRYLVIFNHKKNQFRPVEFIFSKENYDFRSLANSKIHPLDNNRFAIKHPKALEIYSLKF